MKRPLLLGCMVACTFIYPSFSQELVTNVSGSAYAMINSGKQDNENSSLEEVLNTLQSRYKISILYKSDLVKDKIVKNPSYEGSVQEALINVLKPLGLKFKNPKSSLFIIVKENESKDLKISEIDSKTITTEEATALATQTNDLQFLNSLKSNLEKIVDVPVKGKVTSETGDGLPGVSVVVKGTTLGTTTDAGGEYSLNVPDGNAVLVFSFIGYTTEEITVGSRTTVDIALSPDVESLQEVVVVGYGTQKARTVTGAIATVSAKEVAALPVPSVEQAIQGRVPGVAVTSSGGPGEQPLVRIRGIGSISYASSPLYVVDGFPIQGINTGVNGFPAMGLNNFDTKDVESVDVLKDASAAAIYGSRAANGVIIITTKKGSRDGMHVNLDSYYGAQTAWKQQDLLDRDGYIAYATLMRANNGEGVPTRFSNLNEPIYAGATQTYAQTDTDWQNEMFRTAPISHTHLSLTGGNQTSRIYSSVGYFNQKGIMIGTDYERLSFRINSDHNISKRITFGQNLLLSYDDRSNENNTGLGSRSIIQHMMRQIPYIPVTDPTKLGGYRSASGDDASDPENPIRIALQDKNLANSLRIMASGYVDVKLFSGLSYRFTTGVDYVTSRLFTKFPIYNDGFNGRSEAQLADNRFTNFSPIFTNQLTFDRSFGNHTINAVAVVEQQNVIATTMQTGGAFRSNKLDQLNSALNQSARDQRFESALISYIGRITYAYADKYLLTASYRRDGSSVFAPGKKWGNFPAASIGWRLSEEGFLKDNALISELKIRASYGLLGFNAIGPYDWQVTVPQNASPIIGGVPVAGGHFDALGNKELQWEKTKMWNGGLDLGLLNNSITFSMEVYNRLVDNLILQVPTAPSLGYSRDPRINVGEMKNWGYEFQAGYKSSIGDLKFDINANIGITRNEVVKLSSPSANIMSGQFSDISDNITRTEPGQAVQSFYGYVTDGIFQSDEEARNAPTQNLPADLSKYNAQDHTAAGDIKFKDLNNDGVINASDRTFLGSFIPDFNYGFNISANYKGFDLTMFFQGVQGNKIYNLVKWYRQGTPRLFNAGTEVLDSWTPSNTGTDVPRMINGDPNQNGRISDRFIEDGSYLRLKNLSIGYGLPATFLETATGGTIKKARIYFNSLNLLTFTKYTGYDPEIGSKPNQNLISGVDYGQFPSARTFMLGLQIGF